MIALRVPSTVLCRNSACFVMTALPKLRAELGGDGREEHEMETFNPEPQTLLGDNAKISRSRTRHSGDLRLKVKQGERIVTKRRLLGLRKDIG